MGETKIQWTAGDDGSLGKTWNPVRGCVKITPGCANCYASTFAERFRGVKGHAYEQGFDLRLVPEKLDEPLRWRKPVRVFVNSMSDLFQDDVPDTFIADVFATMARTPQHTYQVLTKRHDRMHQWVSGPGVGLMMVALKFWNTGLDGLSVPWPLPNVWLGVSVENQRFANERIPVLLQTPAEKRFISAEPLLEAIDLRYPSLVSGRELDWVIVGGESGPGARPFNLAWARSIVRQCRMSALPVFVKQLGARPVSEHGSFDIPRIAGISRGPRTDLPDIGFRDRKGGDMAEWPDDLRIREFPT